MPSIPMPIREVKEPIDSGRTYLKPSIKEKREEKAKARKAQKPKGEKKPAQKEGTPREER